MNEIHQSYGLCMRKGGFTLLEIVMVIPLIIILSAFIAVSIWDAVFTFRLNAASANILHDIRFTQQLAMGQNVWHGIEFSADPQNDYHVYSTTETTNVNVTNPANLAAELIINVKNQFGVIISAVDIGGGTKVEFSPMGKPYLDMTGEPLSSNGSITLSGGGKTKVIQIIKGSGKAEIL